MEANGDAAVQCALGTMFEEGINVKRNITRALALYSAAAQVLGHTPFPPLLPSPPSNRLWACYPLRAIACKPFPEFKPFPEAHWSRSEHVKPALGRLGSGRRRRARPAALSTEMGPP